VSWCCVVGAINNWREGYCSYALPSPGSLGDDGASSSREVCPLSPRRNGPTAFTYASSLCKFIPSLFFTCAFCVLPDGKGPPKILQPSRGGTRMRIVPRYTTVLRMHEAKPGKELKSRWVILQSRSHGLAMSLDIRQLID
jgi:hypothetical protein